MEIRPVGEKMLDWGTCPRETEPPGLRLSSPGERERNAVMANRVGVNMLQFCSVSNSLSHTTLSIRWEVNFFKRLCRSSLLLCRYDSACICRCICIMCLYSWSWWWLFNTLNCFFFILLLRVWYKATSRHRVILVCLRSSTFASLVQVRLFSTSQPWAVWRKASTQSGVKSSSTSASLLGTPSSLLGSKSSQVYIIF